MSDHEVTPGRDFACIRLVRARENGQQGGLAAPVGTQHADPRPVGDGQVEAVEDAPAAERLDDAARGQEWGWWGHPHSLGVESAAVNSCGCMRLLVPTRTKCSRLLRLLPSGCTVGPRTQDCRQ